MPQTKLENVIFTIMMVIVMVYGMVVYNITLDRGVLTNDVFFIALFELPIMCVVGFIIESLIAGRLAQKMAFKIVTPGQDKPFMIVLAISAMTVVCMCPLMSLVATCLFKGIDSQIIAKWIQLTITNFPMALLWQIFVAGPVVRFLFGHIFNKTKAE
ncbi:MAG: DUF2798 domain-containing protein [Butyrivibrio sp.]|uniref:DUF2798 domain-containing protein n=1 Tax=Butyrivibrio sp. TaxID=28121 RepID=UPI0025DA2CFE|nr:DUF2798 domain-containing protein [Butyrivibrio sp.]MCR5772301.1 DUF2798 domain-containing protein [Butyrivibrio sp.]